MKNFLLSLTLTLLILSNVNAQLVADAGLDRDACSEVLLGGFPPATGGTPPYTYAWNPSNGLDIPNSGVPTFRATVPGVYTFTLTVTDALGAQASDAVTITITDVIIAQSTADTVICIGESIVLGGNPTVSGGTPPYTYSWSPLDGLSSDTIANPVVTPPVSDAYGVQVLDSNGCYAHAFTFIEVLECGSFLATTTDASCFGSCDGSAEVFPTGNYNYLWNNAATTSTIGNLCAGNYSVTVMDSVMNPLDTLSVTIAQPAQIIVTAMPSQVSCAGGNDGAIVLTVMGGTPPYVFLWSDGSTTANQFNIAAGTYSVTIIDGSNCSASASANVQQPTTITVNTFVADESVQGACDGSIDVTVNGGVAGYSFTWSNGVVTEDNTNLCPGAYTVTITDMNGCTATTNGVVGSACPNNTIVLTVTSTGDIDCNRVADTLTAVASGGTTPYTYWWSNAATTPSIVVNQAGIYTAYVADANGCTRSATDTVLNLGVNVTLLLATPVLCNGVPNGSIAVGATGGVPPYTFTWSNGNTGVSNSTDSISGLTSGTYTVTVTDAASCVVTFSHFLNQTGTNWSYYVYVNSTYANCGNNGTATAHVQGGTGPFTYFWNTTPPQTTQTATGLAPGYYTVTVAGSNGCTRNGDVRVYSTCSNIIKGYLYNDANGNCVRDIGETAQTGRYVEAISAADYYYGYTGADGFYTIRVNSPGNFTLSTSSNGSWSNSCASVATCGINTATFSGAGDTLVRDFGFSASTGFDLSLHPGWNGANPGFQKNYHVLYHQTNTPQYNGPATIVFRYDSILVYNSNNNNGVHNASARTITWQVNSVPYPNWDWNTVPRAVFTVPVNTPVGYQLSQEFWLTPTLGDCDTADNYLRIIQPVTGSMDPNEKQVEPAGDIVEEDSVLSYTIHFQNTGNDTTWFVILKDTLSEHLNPATVKNVSSSHPYSSFEVSDHGILTWVFNPIYLVDSATNEPESKGYVMFKVKKKPGLPLTTQIRNKASIYFDYNEPIVTNTVTNTITEPNFIFNTKGDENISVSAMPNPFKASTQIVVEGITTAYDFELFDVTGKVLRKISSLNENRFELKRDDLSAGVYFYRITTANQLRTFGRLVVE